MKSVCLPSRVKTFSSENKNQIIKRSRNKVNEGKRAKPQSHATEKERGIERRLCTQQCRSLAGSGSRGTTTRPQWLRRVFLIPLQSKEDASRKIQCDRLRRSFPAAQEKQTARRPIFGPTEKTITPPWRRQSGDTKVSISIRRGRNFPLHVPLKQRNKNTFLLITLFI